MPYRWEPNAGASGRYRDTSTGRYVQGATVRRELDRYLDTADPAKALAEALRGRQVSLADAEIAFRRMIKNVHLNAVALERGGWSNLTPRDFGLAGQRIRYNYGKARDMFKQIAEGKQRLDGTLAQRMGLYNEAARNTFYRSKQANLKSEATHVRSIRSARDSCRQCLDLDRKIFRIDDASFPLPGQRICLTRCRCHLEYLSLAADDYEVIETV